MTIRSKKKEQAQKKMSPVETRWDISPLQFYMKLDPYESKISLQFCYLKGLKSSPIIKDLNKYITNIILQIHLELSLIILNNHLFVYRTALQDTPSLLFYRNLPKRVC